ncbi:MAG: hypothetical protein CM1200mP2_01980 [Planctomycetaceae bacterium]|nr:MAG: hypothetical protein CM1200mP2_01980 [Planctomycetaceae bacterium]
MAGGGIKGGTVVGSSDKDGMEPDKRPVPVPDLQPASPTPWESIPTARCRHRSVGR